jgi:NADH-quinone oxidoreductase subunit D
MKIIKYSSKYLLINHCLNITTHAIDIGLFTTMVWTFEEREKLIVFIEGLTGTRFHSALLLLGRLRYSVSLFFIDSFVNFVINFVIKVKEIHNILTNNRL